MKRSVHVPELKETLTKLKGLSLATGQCNVKSYNRYLRDLIIAGKAKPSFVVSHEIGIEDAPMAYEKFDKRQDGFTKVLIHPNGPMVADQHPAESFLPEHGTRD